MPWEEDLALPGRPKGLLAMLVSLCAACGSVAAPDAALPDAAPAPDSVCAVPSGMTYAFSNVEIAPPDIGLDLDGDGQVDNALGNIPEAMRTSASSAMQQSLSSGEVLMVMHITDWEDPPSLTDPDLTSYLLWAYDADEPVDASNNLSGDGEFLVPKRLFDLDCQLRNASDEGQLVDGVLSVRAAVWEYAIVVGTGMIRFLDARLECDVDDTLASVSCTLGAAIPLCSLASIPFPGEIEGSILDAIINDPTLSGLFTVDWDRDGDGYEQVIGDGLGVLKCIDGDGEVIQSRDCACHPSIADGFSMALLIDAVPGHLVGVK